MEDGRRGPRVVYGESPLELSKRNEVLSKNLDFKIVKGTKELKVLP